MNRALPLWPLACLERLERGIPEWEFLHGQAPWCILLREAVRKVRPELLAPWEDVEGPGRRRELRRLRRDGEGI